MKNDASFPLVASYELINDTRVHLQALIVNTRLDIDARRVEKMACLSHTRRNILNPADRYWGVSSESLGSRYDLRGITEKRFSPCPPHTRRQLQVQQVIGDGLPVWVDTPPDTSNLELASPTQEQLGIQHHLFILFLQFW